MLSRKPIVSKESQVFAQANDDSKDVRKKRFTGRYSKIDTSDDRSGPTYAVKGERGRKLLFNKNVKGPQNVIKGGPRGYVEGMDAYTHLTRGDIQKEEVRVLFCVASEGINWGENMLKRRRVLLLCFG